MHKSTHKYLQPLFFVFLLGCSELSDERLGANPKPNIVLLIADDMGYADLSCYGGTALTPNLDRLAQKGILFTDFYAAAPNCSPSRSGLMTGRSPARVGMYSYRPPDHPMHLLDEEVTLAELMQAAKYQTAHFGKWHLGCLPQDSSLNHPQPIDHGFEYSLGTENNAQPSHLNPVNFVRNGQPLGEMPGYSCQIVVDEACSWLEKHHEASKPFFWYVAFHEPHAKVASPPELVAKYSQYPPTDAEYLANIENLDAAVGKLLDTLKAAGKSDNTVVIFSSDNGSYRQASNGTLRAKKSYVYEGGIRVPGIFSYPGHWPQGDTVRQAAGFVDILPTLCALTGIDPPTNKKLDGTNLLPLLKNQPFTRQKPLFWFFYRTSPELAMRIENLVILGLDEDTVRQPHRFSEADMAYIRGMEFEKYELYNLNKDLAQYHDLFPEHILSDSLSQLADELLEEIQQEGHYWAELPTMDGQAKRLKKEWNPYQRAEDEW